MDRRLILAVAGSGKTRFLINHLNLEKRFLIVTYTTNNYKNIKSRIINKFGYLPQNISVRTYYSFLLNFCYKPFFHHKWREHGVTWENPPDFTRYKSDWQHYMSSKFYLYSNRLAKLCQIEKDLIKDRLCRYYDCFCFDEVQDLAGYDFDFVLSIIPQNRDALFVGDFFQHTFDTSRDGSKNSSLYKNLKGYCKRWGGVLPIDMSSLTESYRCPKMVCDFVKINLGVNIQSASSEKGAVSFLSDEADIERIVLNDSIPKLFYKNSIKYDCFSMNWGASKGLDDFIDVCVALNKTTCKLYKKNDFDKMEESTRNKFYVACTRTKRNLYFVAEEKLKKHQKENA